MPRPKLARDKKQLSGTLRGHREKPKTAGQALDKAPRPPKHLSEKAAAEWRALIPLAVQLGTVTPADLRAFEMLCATLATVSEAEAVIRAEGMTLETGSGGTRTHPAVKVMEVGRAQAANLLRDFGLTPKGRNHVSPAVSPRASKFGDLIPGRVPR